MGWRSVIITQHAKISYSNHQLVVQTREGTNQVPISDIQVLLITTLSAVITTAAIESLTRSNAKIIFSGRDGQPICETAGYCPSNRSAQLIENQASWNQEIKDQLWTKIVVQKILMQIQVCQKSGVTATELTSELQNIEIGDPSNREAVVAHKYFPCLFGKQFVRHDFDPVNASLNYGYSILLSAVDREIVANGYLTQLGIHHHSEENEFNLGCDLMEPFRPVIDYWIVHQRFNELTPDIKYGLVDLLNFELLYNGEKTLLRTAITKHVLNCLNYLSQKSRSIKMKVELTDEVPNNAINGNV